MSTIQLLKLKIISTLLWGSISKSQMLFLCPEGLTIISILIGVIYLGENRWLAYLCALMVRAQALRQLGLLDSRSLLYSGLKGKRLFRTPHVRHDINLPRWFCIFDYWSVTWPGYLVSSLPSTDFHPLLRRRPWSLMYSSRIALPYFPKLVCQTYFVQTWQGHFGHLETSSYANTSIAIFDARYTAIESHLYKHYRFVFP